MTLKKLPFVFIFANVAASLQTIIWPMLAGSTPAPILWLSIVVYISLNKKISHAILINYVLGLALSVFTSMSLGILWSILLVVTTTIGYFKSRIFWPGLRYYTLMVFFAAIVFHVTSYVLSQFVENNPVELLLFDRTLQIVLTPFFSAPVYWCFEWLERFNDKTDEINHNVEASL